MLYQANPVEFVRCYAYLLSFGKAKLVIRVPRKLSKLINILTVPKTNTGGWIEYIKAFGITELKELGIKASVTSG